MVKVTEDPPRELNAVQDLIELAGRGVSRTIGTMSESSHNFGSQRLAYLSEALKLLNRSWSLVRAAYGPENNAPTVHDFKMHAILQCPESSDPVSPARTEPQSA